MEPYIPRGIHMSNTEKHELNGIRVSKLGIAFGNIAMIFDLRKLVCVCLFAAWIS